MELSLPNVLHFTRLLSVEPLGFLNLFLFLFKKNTIDQMIQDKLCIQRYHLPPGYCYYLPQMKDEEDNLGMKSTILGDVTTFQMYINLFLAVPIFGISLLIGPFIDKYAPAKRALFIYSTII